MKLRKTIVLGLRASSTYILLQSPNCSQCNDQRIKNRTNHFVRSAFREVRVEDVQ